MSLFLAIAAAAAVQAAPVQPAAYQVVRAGDSQLACSALISQINALNAESEAKQMAMSAEMQGTVKRMTSLGMGGGAGGMATSMLASAVSQFLPVGGGMIAQAAAAAQDAARQAAMSKLTDDAAKVQAGAMADLPKAQRLEHLEKLSLAKGC